jgi:hypothetical protein
MMAQFVVGTPIETEEDTIEVTVDPQIPLSQGRHQFQLVVVDDSGNESNPDTVEVIVKDDTKPTAVLGAPGQVEFGATFSLDGRKSSDVPPGKVVKFIWTLVE